MTEQDTEGRRTYYTGSSSQNNTGSEGANFFLFNHRGENGIEIKIKKLRAQIFMI